MFSLNSKIVKLKYFCFFYFKITIFYVSNYKYAFLNFYLIRRFLNTLVFNIFFVLKTIFQYKKKALIFNSELYES